MLWQHDFQIVTAMKTKVHVHESRWPVPDDPGDRVRYADGVNRSELARMHVPADAAVTSDGKT